MKRSIVAIDDEPANLLLIEQYLDGENYDLTCFQSGRDALNYLESSGVVGAILLDRMMPDMDGISFMKEFRTLHQHLLVPVIMQTVASMQSQIAEGIAAGAYYYLTKPYSRQVLRAILARAVSDHDYNWGLHSTAAQMAAATHRIAAVEFAFRTLAEVRDISVFLASLYPEPQSALLGIREIMLNAVEHGNLGISYAEKTAFVQNGQWVHEVDRRLCLPENRAKQAKAKLVRGSGELVLTVEDSGAGFDSRPFMALDIARANDPHGRGIAMACAISFKSVTYLGSGSKVVCKSDC
jgi:CheY-like chemotaxis protein